MQQKLKIDKNSKEYKKQKELNKIRAEIKESFEDIKNARVEYICTKKIILKGNL